MGLTLNLLKAKYAEILASRKRYKAKIITYTAHKKEKAAIELKYAPEEEIYAKETITRTKIADDLRIAISKPIIQKAIKTSLGKNKPVTVLLTKPKSLIPNKSKILTKTPNYLIYIIGVGIGIYLIKKKL